MRVAGSHTIAAPRDEVWEALHDPAVLARTLPGCQQLEVTGPDCYAATVHAGVASVKGLYNGEVRLAEKQAPERYVLRASGAGGPGTIQAEAVVTLHEADGATRIEYDADAVVGGMIGGVGQRMLVGVAQRTAGEFFQAIERELTGVPLAAPPEVPAEPRPAREPAEVGQVFPGRPAPAGLDDATKYLVGALIGAAIALVGVLIGRRTR